ncbi:MAG: nucleoside hydrolase [Corynebacterium glutamicum]|nr:nucleoside hydrolase [Corynebacterium glutamicum]
MTRKIIIDCDPGMDDSVAILLALNNPEVEVIAITTTHGNVGVDTATKSALKILELTGNTDIPVFSGMPQPMIRPRPVDPFSHGEDSQGENFLPEPTLSEKPINAVQALIDLIEQVPGEIHLVATGPLSNIAMAMRQQPGIADSLAGITAISGLFGLNRQGWENATGDNPSSEWNVFVDPEAAEIVYKSAPRLRAIGLDIATVFDSDFNEQQLSRLDQSQNPAAAFLAQAIRFTTARGYLAYTAVIDAFAVASVIHPEMLEFTKAQVGISTSNDITRGMSVLESRHHHQWEDLPTVEIAVSANYQEFLELLVSSFE